jgi:hypothetical protein
MAAAQVSQKVAIVLQLLDFTLTGVKPFLIQVTLQDSLIRSDYLEMLISEILIRIEVVKWYF